MKLLFEIFFESDVRGKARPCTISMHADNASTIKQKIFLDGSVACSGTFIEARIECVLVLGNYEWRILREPCD
jgi:hypothetical protein